MTGAEGGGNDKGRAAAWRGAGGEGQMSREGSDGAGLGLGGRHWGAAEGMGQLESVGGGGRGSAWGQGQWGAGGRQWDTRPCAEVRWPRWADTILGAFGYR